MATFISNQCSRWSRLMVYALMLHNQLDQCSGIRKHMYSKHWYKCKLEADVMSCKWKYLLYTGLQLKNHNFTPSMPKFVRWLQEQTTASWETSCSVHPSDLHAKERFIVLNTLIYMYIRTIFSIPSASMLQYMHLGTFIFCKVEKC